MTLFCPDFGIFWFTQQDVESGAWLLNSGATNHMTFTTTDFTQTSLPRRSNIVNTNCVTSLVTRAGTVKLSPSLQLHNTLLMPSLLYKLLSVSQITIDLNFTVLFYSNFCLIQDILTKEIIGRGTKRGGLYHMEDFSIGRAHFTHLFTSNKEQQILLWRC
ncbi:uncharacterized protein LOC111397659 isoform X1 [Olea europaea var. sylvestris]|uniref:uncharacterized protein LOC111396724 isoform X1 n=1 Tax=Olea europaea var. sylvestris TaxID=158386 RepID=UPI000C1D12B9|nr:uncharacterized protein LOC111396724 isoform X1 [Olea europaea var. sylvestris]XP_022880431.1 uncharacterized protein LOC111397659 isoform X1 [Olea europaea var. sylvestris]